MITLMANMVKLTNAFQDKSKLNVLFCDVRHSRNYLTKSHI